MNNSIVRYGLARYDGEEYLDFSSRSYRDTGEFGSPKDQRDYGNQRELHLWEGNRCELAAKLVSTSEEEETDQQDFR